MPALVFTATANGTSAAQTTTAATRVAAFSGIRSGESVQIEVSDNGSAWSELCSYINNADGRITENVTVSVSLPFGWQIRIVSIGIVGTGTIRVAIE